MLLAYRRAGSPPRAAVVLAFVTLLHACGGGGGDNDGSGAETRARVTIETTNITLAAEPGDRTPERTVKLTITNPPRERALYVCPDYTTSGITGISILGSDVIIAFRSPGRLEDGTYEDHIEIPVGIDSACSEQINGSPATLDIHYTISGGRVASIDRDEVTVDVDGADPNPKLADFRISLDRDAEGGFFISTDQTTNGISTTHTRAVSASEKDVEVVFKTGDELVAGMTDDTMTVRVCYTGACERDVPGSPFAVTTRVRMQARAEPGIEPLPYLSRVTLPHDVVDAEFDRTTNTLIMVSAYPADALHVYDVATGVERSQPLAEAPMSVSLAPDGLTAAVGHDRLVSIVELATVGQPGAPDPVLLDLSIDALDIVLDGAGFVHVFPLNLGQVRSIEIATNTETVGLGIFGQRSHARLHPRGWMYYAESGSPPDQIWRVDIVSGVAAAVYNSPYHGEHDVCGNLWYSEDGERIYTACGNLFSADADQAQDLLFTGALELTPSGFTYGWRIQSLSESVQDEEIALIEDDNYPCDVWPGNGGTCYSHLALYDRQSLARLQVYTFEPVTIDDFAYTHRGVHVFHDATNGRKYIISRAVNHSDPLKTYFLSVVE